MDEAQKLFDSVYTGLEIEKAIAAGLELREDPEQALKNLGAEPAGSAAAVQQNLDDHTGNKNNPHGITAQKIGAQPAFTVLPVAQGGTGVTSIADIAASLFPTKKYTMPSTSYTFAVLGPGWDDNGHMDLPTLASLLSAQLESLKAQTGTYVGTGYRFLNIEFPIEPKFFILTGPRQVPLIIFGPGEDYMAFYLSGSVSSSAITVSKDGNSFEIYAEVNSEIAAFNREGDTYVWIVFY